MKLELFLSILAAVLITSSAQAQFTGDSQTDTISGVASNWAGDYFVGANNAADALLIQSGGVLSNGFGYVGYQFGAVFNTVLVTGSGSAWSNANDLSVGYLGALNSMTISNGGAVNNSHGYVGNQAGADDNAVLVTDSGSVWRNTNDLSIGFAGAENSLTITNGGTVYDGNSSIGLGSGANNNTVVVTGSGSVWSNAGALIVGLFGSGNSLTIASSGTVYNTYGYIAAAGSLPNNVRNGTVLVTDGGSVWNNANDLYVGDLGAVNSLTVSNGGAVLTGGNGYIGYDADSNTVLVTDGGSLWDISGFLYVGDYGGGNSLIITNGGYVACSAGGVIGGSGASSYNTLVVTAGGSLVVTNAAGNATLVVSQTGGTDSLVLNGGAVTANQLDLLNGLNSIVTLNAGTLNSGGTLVVAPQTFVVGDGADAAVFHLSSGVHAFGNNLEINNNAVLTGCGTIYGDVLIDGGGAVLADCGGTLTIFGSVTNNGSIVATNGTVINFYGPVFNNGQIGPTNSVNYYPAPSSTGDTNSWIGPASDKWEADPDWSAGLPSIIQPAMYITNASSKTVTMDLTTAIAFPATLTISNLTVSAPLNSTNTFLLNAMGATTPLQIISNLNVNAGGIVTVTNSALEIDGAGVVLGISGLFVGVNSAGEQLSIQGGQVGDESAYLGYNSSSSNNTVLVAGHGSVWSNTGDLNVGYYGAGNSLIITDGAMVTEGTGPSATTAVGYQPGANNNSVLVTGNGSVWRSAGFLYFGEGGSGNSLTIVSSGTVYTGYSYIGYEPGASNNTVLVTGSGSVWSNTFDLHVGQNGVGNSLIITNGAVVTVGGDGVLGFSGSNNIVTVRGNGAAWRMLGGLYVGWGGSSNKLVIGTGGSVLADQVAITLPIYSITGSNNVVQVNGGSLFATNAQGNGTLVVSQAGGPGSLVINSGSVAVNQLVLTNGANSVIAFNGGLLTSSGTSVSNSQPFVVGDGTDAATFHLNGGVHSFADSLEISNNATLSGCGTIEGNVTIDPGGTLIADCGGMLTFTGIVTNNGTMLAVNGTVLQAYGQVVNNGVINVINGSAQFLGGLVNNGCVLTAANVRISSITRSGNNITVQIPSGSCGTYQIEVTPSLKPATWTNLSASQDGTGGVLTFTDTGGATNRPGRFYRIDITLP